MSRYKASPIITKGSLCSGIGALDAATPGELKWVAEKDEAAARVLKREHPEAVNMGDITVPGLHPGAVDLVTSGDPCQSMSAAGRQMASADERFLWPDVMRIVERVRPGHVFLENVQNLVSVPLFPGADRGTVLALRLDDLWRAGYEVRWTVVGACAVGAPHHRHRWFLRARWFGIGAPAPVRVGKAAFCGAPRRGGRMLLPTPVAADSRNTRNATARRQGGTGGNAGVTLSDVGHDFAAAALLPTPMSSDHKEPGKSRERPWGNLPSYVHHLLPTPTTADGEGGPGRSARRAGGDNLRTAASLLPTPTAANAHGNDVNGRGDLLLPGAVHPEVWGRFAEAVALWEQVTGVPAPEPTEPAPKGGRRLNPALPEWMMGYPAGFLTSEMSRSEALRAAGNGVVSRQACAAWELLGEGW